MNTEAQCRNYLLTQLLNEYKYNLTNCYAEITTIA